MEPLINVSAPGRICLFGEHQDYLHLPVITQAINLRLKISGRLTPERRCRIDLPDIGGREEFDLPPVGQKTVYVRDRDYFRTVYNVLIDEGLHFERGCSVRITSQIPINSGTSSSSALCVAWTRFLLSMASNAQKMLNDAAFIGRVAYRAEVEEFGEPGGMMDQYACAVGGVLYQDFKDGVRLQSLTFATGSMVLGDSLEPKDTRAILHRVKDGVLNAVQKIQKKNPAFSIYDAVPGQLPDYRALLSADEMEVLTGALLNRDITRRALPLLQSGQMEHRELGRMLWEHQQALANYSRISTPKIDAMLKAAMDAGAYGGKINGSGGGGCMFAYAPENPERVAAAIEKAGGKAYILKMDGGVRRDKGV